MAVSVPLWRLLWDAKRDYYRNLGILFAIMFIFGIIHFLATELIPARRSRGEILLFKRPSWMKKLSAKLDEESGDLTNFSQDTSLVGSVVGIHQGVDNVKGKPVIDTVQMQTSVFHWSNLTYEIKTKDSTRSILNSIDGWVKPGTLTALMVSSHPCLSLFIQVSSRADQPEGPNRGWQDDASGRPRRPGHSRRDIRRSFHRRQTER